MGELQLKGLIRAPQPSVGLAQGHGGCFWPLSPLELRFLPCHLVSIDIKGRSLGID